MAGFDGVNGPQLKIKFLINSSWVTVTQTDVREIQIKRGRSRADQKNDPGSATIVFDNISGYYDPEYTGSGSPYVVSGVNQLKAGTKVQIFGTWASTDYSLFVGYLETNTIDQGFSPTATMIFTDGIALLAKMYPLPLNMPSYSGETTATRVGRMLDYANWTDARSISGSVTLLPTTQTSSLQLIIEECVNAEAGRFYISRDGTATFAPLSAKFSAPTRLQLSDSRAANTVEYESMKATPGTYQVINEAIVQRNGGSQRRSRHLPSTTSFGLKSITVNAPILSDTSADNLAKYLSRKDSDPQSLIETIGFNALALDTLYPDFLSLELSDQLTVNRTTVDGRNLSYYVVVEGYQHTIQSNPGSWMTTVMTSPMNGYNITI